MTTPVSYTALARRYRPQTFAEVIGQEHVATALRNAIRKDRVAHAYLFTGARGVGKTSTARIFAKALNCPNAVEGIPCNHCDICRSISVGQDVDVLEIDAASNRGIDDIRQLRANVNLRPMRSRNKVYIVDEAHQLSRDAWNALLKTLEEPPPNVKFFFCTTEPNKLPDTILSRCQRFDFSSVEQQSIIDRLKQIAEQEKFIVEAAALELVARRAAGSMRDSQSLFDQLLAFGGETITVADVHRLFGTADDDRLIALGAAIIGHRPAEVLTILSEALAAGVQVGELFDQLISYFRDLMVLAAGAEEVDLISVAEAHRSDLVEQAGQIGLQTLLAAMQILSEARQRLSRSGFLRPIAELALTRITLLSDLDDLADLIASVRGGTAGATRRPTGGNPPARKIPAASDGEGPQKKSNVTPPPAATGPAETAAAPPAVTEPEPRAQTYAPQTSGPPVSTPPGSAPPGNAPPGSMPKVSFSFGQEGVITRLLVEKVNPFLKTNLQAAESVAISGPNTLDFIFPKQYRAAYQYCEGPGRAGLEAALAELTGRTVRIVCRLTEGATEPDDESTGSMAAAKPVTKITWQRLEPTELEDELVARAATLFEVNDVRVRSIGERDSQGQRDS